MYRSSKLRKAEKIRSVGQPQSRENKISGSTYSSLKGNTVHFNLRNVPVRVHLEAPWWIKSIEHKLHRKAMQNKNIQTNRRTSNRIRARDMNVWKTYHSACIQPLPFRDGYTGCSVQVVWKFGTWLYVQCWVKKRKAISTCARLSAVISLTAF